jgi:hypothetical protein
MKTKRRRQRLEVSVGSWEGGVEEEENEEEEV